MISARVEMFVQVAQCGSFSKAAEQRYLSPVAVMKQMNGLEAQVGVQLLIRSSRGVQLTEAGNVLYHEAKELILRAQEAMEKVRASTQELPYIVRVGTSMLYPCKPLLHLWNQIDQGHGAFRLRIIPFQDASDALQGMLRTMGGEFDFFVGPILHPPGQEDVVQAHWLQNCHICVAFPHTHRLSGRQQIEIADLAGQRLYMPPRGSSLILDGLRRCLARECPSVVVLDTPAYYGLEQFNRCEQDGAALLTLDLWRDVHPALSTVMVNWPYTLPFGLLCAANPSPQVQRFLHMVEAWKRQTGKIYMKNDA